MATVDLLAQLLVQQSQPMQQGMQHGMLVIGEAEVAEAGNKRDDSGKRGFNDKAVGRVENKPNRTTGNSGARRILLSSATRG